MRKSKYHMEIRRVNDLSPALIHPDFLLHSLTVGARIFNSHMQYSSHPVKRTGDVSGIMGGKVDIDECRMQGFMAHEMFDREQVCPILIKVCAKSKPEGMTG